MRSLWRAVSAFLSTDDPRLAIAHAVVIAVMGNQPFYPLYVAWLAPAGAKAAMVSWLSAPAFAAVPAVGRRAPTAAKLLLVGAGLGNTALCTLALGPASGVPLFYLPCLALPLVLFAPGRRGPLALATLAVAAVLFGTIGALAPERFPPDAGAALTRMHAISVACLMGLIALRSWMALRRTA